MNIQKFMQIIFFEQLLPMEKKSENTATLHTVTFKCMYTIAVSSKYDILGKSYSLKFKEHAYLNVISAFSPS